MIEGWKEKLREMWDAAVPQREIGPAIGCTAPWVSVLAKRIGLPPRPPSVPKVYIWKRNPEMNAQLTRLWAAGMSTREIAREMGISKNQVISRAHRIGLPSRASPIKHKVSPEERAKRKAEREAGHQRRLMREAMRARPWAALEDRPRSGQRCAWLEGEPGPGQRWKDVERCEEKAMAGSSYCPRHHAICYIRRGTPEYRHELNKQLATGDFIKTPGHAHVVLAA